MDLFYVHNPEYVNAAPAYIRAHPSNLVSPGGLKVFTVREDIDMITVARGSSTLPPGGLQPTYYPSFTQPSPSLVSPGAVNMYSFQQDTDTAPQSDLLTGPQPVHSGPLTVGKLGKDQTPGPAPGHEDRSTKTKSYSNLLQRQQQLVLYYRTVCHKDAAPEYYCTLCPYECSTVRLIEIHIKNHGDVKHVGALMIKESYTLKCSECKYVGKFRKRLMTHMKRHERPFKCSQCDYSATHKWNLLSHVRNHTGSRTGERPFKCPNCPYSAAQGMSLVKHLKLCTVCRPDQTRMRIMEIVARTSPNEIEEQSRPRAENDG